MPLSEQLAGQLEDKNEATKKLEWIKARLAEGRTVYLTTHTRSTKITSKNLGQVRIRDGHLEVQHGKRWLIHDYSRLSAR